MASKGKTRRLLKKDYRAEVKAIQKAAKKRGLFASVGGFLGGALATALTGGAAAPMVAAMMAGGGNYLGRKLGASLSKTDIKKAGGGKFAKSARKDILSQLHEQDVVSALKGGLFAGIGQMGGLSKILGKGKGATGAGSTKVASEGLKQGILPKGTLSKLFKSSDPKALASQKGIGSLIDFRGSSIGKGLQTMAFKNKGWIDPNLQSGAGNMPVVAMDRRLQPSYTSSLANVADDARAALGSAPSFDDVMSYTDGTEKMNWASGDPIPKTTPNWRTDLQQEAVRLSHRGSGVTDRTLSKPDFNLDYMKKEINIPEFSASDAQDLAIQNSLVPSEYGFSKGVTWGETAVTPGSSDMSHGIFDDSQYTGNIPDLTTMYQDELQQNLPTASGIETMGIDRDYWEAGGDLKDRIGDTPIDFDQPSKISADMTTFPKKPVYTQSTTDSPGNFLPSGRNTHLDAIKQKLASTQVVEGLSEESTGTGLSPVEELFAGPQDFTQGLGVDLSKYDLLQKSTSNRNKLRQSSSRYKRLFGK